MSTQDSSHSPLFQTPKNEEGPSLSPTGPHTVVPPPLPEARDSSQPTGVAPPIAPPRLSRGNGVADRSVIDEGKTRAAKPILLDDDPQTILGHESPAERTGSRDLTDRLGAMLYRTPAWLISLVVHLAVFLVLALLVFQLPTNNVLHLNAIFSDRTGEQLEFDTFEASTLSEMPDNTPSVESDLPPVDFPLAAPAALAPSPEAAHEQVDLNAPIISAALAGRQEGRKEVLLKAFGGNAATENAVQMGLEWLKRYQRKDGSWSLSGPYKDGCGTENRVAATAMAMLAFQGAGHTHLAGTFRSQVNRARRWLLKQQETGGKQSGRFYTARHAFFKGEDNHTFYSNGMATMAICELYAMSADESLKYPAQMAVDFLVRNQNPDGGWRYVRDTASDTSVTGWIVMALQSAKMGGLNVPEETFPRIGEFLDSVASDDYGTRYAYLTGQVDTLSMTAEALLCRQYLGWPQDHQPLITGAQHFLDHPIQLQNKNLYYWYYATQVLHHMEGDMWDEWNLVMRKALPKHQERHGKQRGSWAPHNDRWGEYAGRLFSTCFHIYMLEVYYRHLPIYSRVYE